MNAADQIRAQRVIGIVRTRTPESALRMAQDLITAGIASVEVSLVTPDAVSVISELLAWTRQEEPRAVQPFVGAGTVMTSTQFASVLNAGAQFVVTPDVNPDVVRGCADAQIPVVPGVCTPTEAAVASRLGARMLKLFPASNWSPAAMRDILAAMPSIEFVPTGGISRQDAPNWIAAGAAAVGMGSALSSGSRSTIQHACESLLESLRKAR